jgi:hypothetical protein
MILTGLIRGTVACQICGLGTCEGDPPPQIEPFMLLPVEIFSEPTRGYWKSEEGNPRLAIGNRLLL